MGYIKAETILPEELIELIQQYVDGTNIYIPRKSDHRQEWGTATGYKCELHKRNQVIWNQYLSGTSINDLAKHYYLSRKSIQRIIRSMKV